MDTMTIEDLSTRLRANAKGSHPAEAAIELLIRSDVWLRRSGFRAACVKTRGPTEEYPHHEVGAYLDWDAVGNALTASTDGQPVPEWLGVCSGGERRLIRIAHDIADGPMSDVGALDRGNVALVVAAVSHASGAHEHGNTVLTLDADGVLRRSPATPENSGPLFPWPQSGELGDRS